MGPRAWTRLLPRIRWWWVQERIEQVRVLAMGRDIRQCEHYKLLYRTVVIVPYARRILAEVHTTYASWYDFHLHWKKSLLSEPEEGLGENAQ